MLPCIEIFEIFSYLSTVNAVIVSTVAFADVSAANPCRTHMASLNGYGYRYHIL